MITISLCMIVKNEEEVLARCLTCAKQFVDEIIIVDTGSEDQTKAIAKTFTDHVFDFTWIDDFSAARNEAFSKANCDYTMWLDADDVVLPEDIQKLLELKNTLQPDVNIVMMKYHTAFDAEGNPVFSYYRERLVNTTAHIKWEGAIHEVLPLCGKLQYEDIAITHRKMHVSDPDRNLKIFENRQRQGIIFTPREQFYYARELYYHQRYQAAIEVFDAFLEERKGWVENTIDACEMIGYSYYALKQEEKALLSFYRSFLYDLPRGELCCDIAKHYFDRAAYEKAIYWYEAALTSKRKDENGGFVRGDCYGYIPNIQLCVCWYQLKDVDKAIYYNEEAGRYKESKEVIANRLFFQQNER